MMKTNVQTNIGCIFNELLQRLESPGEFKIPEWLKKDSMSYTLIRRNIYLTKKVKARAEDDGMFCSCNPAMGSRGVCDRDCFCGMLFSSCSHSCKCGSACLNKPFQHRTMKRMKMIETERCGFGLVADEDIKQGEFVIEYVGEVINDKICEERLWKMKHRGETNFYLCEINRDTVIDATYKGNKSRFINHSCQPNTEMQKWRIDGETRIGIFAIRDIKKGEELTYDYQFVQFGADQNCYCGATVCRGKLGSKPTKDLLNGRSYSGTVHLSDSHQAKPFLQNCIEQIVRIWCPQDKRYYGGVILSFNNSSKEHTILKEDGHLIILDLSKEEWNFL